MKTRETVYITELETEVLGVFVRRKILKSGTIINTLESVIEKIRGYEDDRKA